MPFEAHDSPESHDAPAPDDRTGSGKPTWGYTLGRTVREFTADECTDLAAALTYYAVLALFPGLLALVSLLGILGQQGNTHALLDVLSDVGAGAAEPQQCEAIADAVLRRAAIVEPDVR